MQPKHTYTKADLTYAQDNLVKEGYLSVAVHIGVGISALKKQVTSWREQGHDIPFLRKNTPIGAIRMRNDGRRVREYIKTENGWRRVLYKRPSGQPLKKVKRKTKPKQQPMPKLKAPKPEKKICATRSVDLTNKVAVCIPERRLTVYVKPGTDAEAVRRKYQDHYEFMSKKAI
jgi:hypothetical protein